MGTWRSLRLALAEKQAPFDLRQDLRIEAEGQVRGVPQDVLFLVVGGEIPLAGRMTLDASLEGVPAELEGRGHVRVMDAVVLGEPWEALEADLTLEADRLHFEELRLARGAERVTGSGLLHLKARTTTFHLATTGLSLDGFRRLAGTRLAGKIGGEVLGRATTLREGEARPGKIPLFGRLLFGKEQSVPVVAVAVKGPLASPKVAAVPQESLGRGVFGILRRVLELPAEVLPGKKSGSHK